jgi:transposase
VLYLPPYSPMLNPIETWFGELKRIVKSKIYKTRQAMKSELIRVLETFRNKSMANYYRGIEKYVQLGLKKELYRGNNKF